MTAKSDKIIPGKILIAEPFMQDPNFRRSVIFICENDEKEGTVGFVLNKEMDIEVNSLLKDFPPFESQCFYGGPVATDTIHYIHDVGDILEESIHIRDNLYWGGNFEQLKFLIERELVLPRNIRFFVGYSGWSSGQLDAEMKLGSWIVGEMDFNYAFYNSPEKLWKNCLINKGDSYSVISQIPDVKNNN